MQKLPKPTKESVEKLYRKLYDDWGARFKEDEEFQDMVNQENIIETLDSSNNRVITPLTIHSGRSGGIIEHAAGLVASSPSFMMKELGPATLEKFEAEEVETFCATLFEQQFIYTDFWTQLAKDILTMGRGFVRAQASPSVWTAQMGYPARGQNEAASKYLARVDKWKYEDGKFPFVIQHIPTMNLLPLLDAQDNVLAAVEEKIVTVGALAELGSATAKEGLANGSKDWFDEMLVLEYTDTDYCSYYLLVNTVPSDRDITSWDIGPLEELRVWEHYMGRCPIVMFPGLRSGQNEYTNRYKSFLDTAKESLEAYDFLISRLATMVWAYFMPSYIWRSAESSAAFKGRERPELKVILGGTTTLLGDEDLQPLPYPPNLPDASLLMTHIDDLIQRHTLEDVLFGRVIGSAPAFQVNLRINVARSKFTPIVQHLAQGIVKVMELVMRGVEVVGEAVVVGGEKLSVATAKKAQGRISASIEPKSPVDRSQDIGQANMAKDFGMPWDWIVVNILGVQNPASLRLEKFVEDLENTDEAKLRLVTEVFTELDMLTEQEEFSDVAGLDLSQFPPEAIEAIEQMVGSGGGGLGRGPYPAGGAPQTIQGGRGLLTEKAQPQPGGVKVGESNPILENQQ